MLVIIFILAMSTIKDVELVKDAVAKLRPGYDLVFRAFVCYVCEETLPLVIEGRSEDTCTGEHDFCICSKYIGLVCIPCEKAVGVEVQCCVCGKERGYTHVRCKQESCQLSYASGASLTKNTRRKNNLFCAARLDVDDHEDAFDRFFEFHLHVLAGPNGYHVLVFIR